MKRMLTIIAAVVLVASCAGVSNLRLNEELTNLYTAQIDARDSDDVILKETVGEAFRSLALRAEDQAQKATTTEDAVSFYRIAATAAWQGESTNVEALGNSGWMKCEEPGFDKARRDCVMLLVIPDLAATDGLTTSLDDVKSRVNAERAKPADQQSPAVLGEIGNASDDIFDKLNSRFGVLSEARAEFSTASLPSALLDRLKKNQDFIFCRMRDANGMLLRAVGNTDARFTRNQATLETIRREHDPNNQINCATT